ncbi:MAG: beta-propeller domain-containing protein, partial [Clostridia bacterium]|nr:beta-propeller domain-containing protein [Clostridia bacterium]
MTTFDNDYAEAMRELKPGEAAMEKTAEDLRACSRNVTKKTRSAFGWAMGVAAMCACIMLVAAVAGPLLFLRRARVNNRLAGIPFLVPGAVAENAADYKDVYTRVMAGRGGENQNNGGLAKQIAGLGARTSRNESLEMAETSFDMPAQAHEVTYTTSDDAGPAYSDTNNQVAGIQEADIVKTDGRYIYASYSKYRNYYDKAYNEYQLQADQSVQIIRCDNGQLQKTAVIPVEANMENAELSLREMLLMGDKLLLIKEGAKKTDDRDDYIAYMEGIITAVEVWNIADRANPVFQGQLYQSGSYNSSRVSDGFVYMITTQGIYDPQAAQPRTFVPYCSEATEDTLVPATSIYTLPEGNAETYTVVTGMDPADPSAHTSQVAFLAAGGQLYVSQNNIYVACNEYTMNWQPRADSPAEARNCTTTIHRLSYDKGEIAYAGSGAVPGTLINQFAMDEFEGHLRVATTVTEYKLQNDKMMGGLFRNYWYEHVDTYNNLFVLSTANMETVGSVTGMAPGETIFSVRFDGKIGYMVTFEQV